MIARRSLLLGIGSLFAAPAIVKADSLMRISRQPFMTFYVSRSWRTAEDIERAIRPPFLLDGDAALTHTPARLIPGSVTYVRHAHLSRVIAERYPLDNNLV